MNRLVGLLTLLISFSSLGQEDSLLKAIGYYEALDDPKIEDTSFIDIIKEKIEAVIYIDAQKAHRYARAMYELSQKLQYKKGIALGLMKIADAKMHSDQLDSGMDFARKCITYCENNQLSEWLMGGHLSLGNGYYYKGQYDKAITEYFSAADIAEKQYEMKLAGCYGAIGNAFRAAQNYEKSQEYLLKGYRLAKVYQDTTDMVFLLNNLGIVAKNENDNEQALSYYEEGLELAVLIGSLRREGEFVYNMANVHFRMGNKEKGFELLERSAEITAIQGTKRDLAIEHYNIGHWHNVFGNHRQAVKHSLIAMDYAEEVEYLDVLEASSEVLSLAYGELGQYKEAFIYGNLRTMYHDSISKMTDDNMMLEIENQYELDKIAYQDSLSKEKDELERAHQLSLNNEKVQSRENLLYAAAGILFLVIIGIVLLFRSNKKVREKNQKISESHQVITQQKEQIEEVHKEITDSINYAQRIQQALISGNEEWDKISLNHSILFKPKDVVSGDFYWAYHSEAENLSIWVTADCTGHGVPGAFMSMLGIGFLNEIIVENKVRNGGLILDQLRDKIIKALSQKGGDAQQKDGMDLALCIWDKNSNKLEFTGANNPLWIIRSTENTDLNAWEKVHHHADNGFCLLEIKPNKMPVGLQSDAQENFKSTSVNLLEGDLLVSFTDGYADQFGGDKGKKLKYKPFKDILLNLRSTPVKLHSGILEEKFELWMGPHEQIDDVCVISVQV